MFCQKCGTAIAESATACSSCNTPVSQVKNAASGAVADTVKGSSRDAFAAFKIIAVNPYVGLPLAYEQLGDAKALRAGVAFGIVSMICFLFGGYLLLPPYFREEIFEALGFGGVVKCLLFAVAPFVCTAVCNLAVRKVWGSGGSLGGDCFVSGAALLPASICIVLAGLLGFANADLIGVLMVFAGCISILMLFAGYTRIAKLTERTGTIAVPIVIILSAWLSKTIFSSMLNRDM